MFSPASQAFFTADSLAGSRGKLSQVLLVILMMALFHSSVPVSHDHVTVSQHEIQQDPEVAKWNSDMAKVIIYTCVFRSVT